MGSMRRAISAVLILAAAIAAAPVKHAATTAVPVKHAAKSPAPTATLPPEIGHVVSRPFCSALRTHIGPAIGTILQNDNILRPVPKLFDDYNRFDGNGETSQAHKDLTVMKMENTVGPLVANIATTKKELDDTAVFHVPPRTADEKRLLEMREQLLDVLGMQEAQLDLVNGFVQTKQLGDIQQAGEGINDQINGDVDQSKVTGQATPVPGLQQENLGGLKPDPHFVDPTKIPGLTLGSNPITRLNAGLQWAQAQTQKREDLASTKVIEATRLCGAPAAPKPAPGT